jgi:hypothetical protein
MSDDFDAAIDRLTLDQKQALASILHTAMTADSIRRQAAQKPGEVAFTRPVADMVKRDGETG